jgi:hypothetical protein
VRRQQPWHTQRAWERVQWWAPLFSIIKKYYNSQIKNQIKFCFHNKKIL